MATIRNKISIDSIIVFIAIGYIIVPVLVFMYGWLKWPIAIVSSVLLIALWFQLSGDMSSEDYPSILVRRNWSFWAIVLIAVGGWLYLSGIGGFSYQNSDYFVRNPIYDDLTSYSWPVTYDLSQESDVVRSICGDDRVAFSYYFCWWLPPALLSKIIGVNGLGQNMILYGWAYLGIILIIYMLCRRFNRCSWIIPVLFVFFSGLDVIPYTIRQLNVPVLAHIEWWAHTFQYSSNTTQLYWVFNQSIPAWLLVALLLQQRTGRYVAGLSAIMFAYSPWATIGMVPIALAVMLSKGDIKRDFNVTNIVVPLVMLISLGGLYMSGSGSGSYIGLSYDGSGIKYVVKYVLFIIIEVLIYFSVLGKNIQQDALYWTVLAELILFPLIIIKDKNFTMRGSIPALFILMFYVMTYLIENGSREEIRWRTRILILALCIGAITPICEINRSVIKTATLSSTEYLENDIGSFGDILTDDTARINTIKEQFFVYDYNDNWYFRYLVK